MKKKMNGETNLSAYVKCKFKIIEENYKDSCFDEKGFFRIDMDEKNMVDYHFYCDKKMGEDFAPEFEKFGCAKCKYYCDEGQLSLFDNEEMSQEEMAKKNFEAKQRLLNMREHFIFE